MNERRISDGVDKTISNSAWCGEFEPINHPVKFANQEIELDHNTITDAMRSALVRYQVKRAHDLDAESIFDEYIELYRNNKL